MEQTINSTKFDDFYNDDFWKDVCYYLRVLTCIPRSSNETSMTIISNYLKAFAIRHNLTCYHDTTNNVTMVKEASIGRKKEQGIGFFAHMDMVEAGHGPISLVNDDKFIFAKQRNAGLDDAYGLALILAILANDKISHPRIVACITSLEEVGFVGAKFYDVDEASHQLGINLKEIPFINLDFVEMKLCSASSGGKSCTVNIPLSKEISSGYAINVKVAGLSGGHDGVYIGLNKYNAIKLLNYWLNKALNGSFKLLDIRGGNAVNQIPAESEATIVVEDMKQALKALTSTQREIILSCAPSDPDLNLFCAPVGEDGEPKYRKYNCISNTQLLLSALREAQTGVVCTGLDCDITRVETSINFGVLKLDPDTANLSFLIRSFNNDHLIKLVDEIKKFAEKFRGRINTDFEYLPWECSNNSFTDFLKKVYFKLFDESLEETTVNGGLEAGVFAAKGIRIIACLGALLEDEHSLTEKLEIDSYYKLCVFVTAILQTKRKNPTEE